MNKDRFKFRVWNKKEKILHYGVEKTYDYMHGNPIICATCFGDLLDDNNYIVEQCTGLKDKNGKLIYEGDIIRRDNGHRKVIRYYHGGFGWWTEYFDFISFAEHRNIDEILKKHEIICNIHDDQFRDPTKMTENKQHEVKKMIEIKFKETENRPSFMVDANTIKEVLKMAIEYGADLTGVDLHGADLTGVNLHGVDLHGADLTGVNLHGADLTGADLTGADLFRANLSRANLIGANLAEANLKEAYLFRANLEEANLHEVRLVNADLTGANLDYSCWPLWCGSLNIKIDKRQACQLLYHTLRAMQSVDDPEIREILADSKIINLANKFDRVNECGRIEMNKDE